MGIIEPYHIVGFDRQGPNLVGEQLACFDWM